MSGAARLGDIGSAHGCFAPTPIITASNNVLINGKPAARQGDALAPHGCGCAGKHASHPRTIAGGSTGVWIDGKPAVRLGDAIDCGGIIISASNDVIIGQEYGLKK